MAKTTHFSFCAIEECRVPHNQFLSSGHFLTLKKKVATLELSTWYVHHSYGNYSSSGCGGRAHSSQYFHLVKLLLHYLIDIHFVEHLMPNSPVLPGTVPLLQQLVQN